MSSRPNSYQKQLVRYRSIMLLEVYVDSERMVDCILLIKADFKHVVDSSSRGHQVSSLFTLTYNRGAVQPALWGPKVACKSSQCCVAE